MKRTYGLGTYYTDVVFVRLVCVDSYIWLNDLGIWIDGIAQKHTLTDEKTDTEDEDSELRDWFQIQRKHTAPTSAEMSDSATDPDSDHEDFEEPIDVDDEWLSVDIPEESTDNEVSQDSVCPFSSFVTFLLDDKISRSWQFQSQKYISCRFDSMTISDRHP